VITYRNDEPGQQRLGPYLAELDRASRVERIDLRRLDQVETVTQLAGILGVAPATGLVDAVFARSQGNPFFTEELLAMVRAGSDGLPATLRDLLRGRGAALPDPASKVLEVVAMAGRRTSHRLLAAVVGLDDQGLVKALRAAVGSQLLVTVPDLDGYKVRHALLREVIDADLLPGERARLHAALAQTLTDQPELAAHWDAAGEPPEPCQPGSRPAWPPSGPTPSPRPKATTSAPSSCGSRSPTRPGRPPSATRSTSSSGPSSPRSRSTRCPASSPGAKTSSTW
jgi:hypothetical protein